MEPRARDALFLLIYNKLPVLERLFRIRLRNDPYCLTCEGAEIADAEHFFCSCAKVGSIWPWVRQKVVEYARCSQNISDWEILNLFVPDSDLDVEVTWLISAVM